MRSKKGHPVEKESVRRPTTLKTLWILKSASETKTVESGAKFLALVIRDHIANVSLNSKVKVGAACGQYKFH